MLDAKGFLQRIVLVALISALPGFVNVVSAHGGGHGSGGSGGSGGGSSSSGSSGGHSSTGTTGGHTSGGSSSGHSATSSKASRFGTDPSSISGTVVRSQTAASVSFHSKDRRSFDRDDFNRSRFNRAISTGETGQNIQMGMVPNEDWKRRHRRLWFGFLPY